MELTRRQKRALEDLLVKIGSWTPARWDQHLRYDVGDADTDAIVLWFRYHGMNPFGSGSTCEKKDSNGVRCELPYQHDGDCACPKALAAFEASRKR